VTGVDTPSSENTRVMPIFFPTNPKLMIKPLLSLKYSNG
jgi:hypothetical protein